MLFGNKKKNQILTHISKCIKLKNIILSEKSQTQRAHIAWFNLYKRSKECKFIETENRLKVDWAGGQNKKWLQMDTGFLGAVYGNVSILDCGNSYAILYIY